MKKIFTLAALFLSVAVFATGYRDVKTSDMKEKRPLQLTAPVNMQQKQNVAQKGFEALAKDRFTIDKQLPLKHRHFSKTSSRKKIQVLDYENNDLFYAEYGNPKGTLFGGIDRVGFGWYFDLPAVFGAWKQGIDPWLWPNYSKGAKSFKWQTSWYKKYKDGISWDSDNNLVDTIPALWKGNIDYAWSYQRAVLFATGEKGRLDTFVLNAPQTERIDTLDADGNVFAGAENPLFLWHKAYAEYGWDKNADLCSDQYVPLCNVPTIVRDTGINALNYYLMEPYKVGDETVLAYFYGTNAYPWFLQVTEEGVDYNTPHSVIPAAIVQEYEKPQVPLYIHDVTLPLLGAWSELGGFAEPVLNSPLRLRIYKLNGEEEELLADVTASAENLKEAMYMPGSMLTFPIEEVDELGDVISEGIVVDSEFYVLITGMDGEGNDFGMISGYSPYGGLCYIFDGEGNMYVDGYNNAPYINLNGSYTTFEVADADWDAPAYERIFSAKEPNRDNQTINVQLMEWDEDYLAVVGEDDYSSLYTVPILCILSTFTPVDTFSNELLVDVIAPEYVEAVDFDIAEELQEGAGISWFTYTGMTSFLAFIPVEERDNVYNGDEIILSKGGRTITLVMTGEKDRPTALNEVKDSRATVARDNDMFRLTYTNDFNRVEMINANGQRVADYQLPQNGEFTINASSMPNGVYMFRLTGKNTSETLRAIK